MNAVDTNLLVRLIARDDEEQARQVEGLFASPTPVFVPTSVVVETAGVLRHVFDFDQTRIAGGLANLFGLPNVVAEHPDRVAFAIAATEVGVEFIDALHVASAERCDVMLTFDKAFARRAPKTGCAVAVALL